MCPDKKVDNDHTPDDKTFENENENKNPTMGKTVIYGINRFFLI